MPQTINAIGRKHWAVKVKEANHWKSLVAISVRANRPKKPLSRATLRFRRNSSKDCDPDNLCGSFKHVLDGLVEAGILVNDRYLNIGMPTYEWSKTKMGEGFIEVWITEL